MKITIEFYSTAHSVETPILQTPAGEIDEITTAECVAHFARLLHAAGMPNVGDYVRNLDEEFETKQEK